MNLGTESQPRSSMCQTAPTSWETRKAKVSSTNANVRTPLTSQKPFAESLLTQSPQKPCSLLSPPPVVSPTLCRDSNDVWLPSVQHLALEIAFISW